MFTMSEHYIILNECELGAHGKALLAIFRGQAKKLIADHWYKIQCASEAQQKHLFDRFSEAIDKDFPPPCEDCGNEHDECCCDDELDSEPTRCPYCDNDGLNCNHPTAHLPNAPEPRR